MQQGEVRIISGKWRGRKLKVPHVQGLRPTPDRIRETLFNWLAPVIEGACCLDLFAGSGALGFEALSRGAAYVLMFDQSPMVVALLLKELKQFGAINAHVQCGQFPHVIPKVANISNKLYDIVFLDPPYQANILLATCFQLEEQNMLAKTSYIYLESKTALSATMLPSNWLIIKQKKAGQVYYQLVLRKIDEKLAITTITK